MARTDVRSTALVLGASVGYGRMVPGGDDHHNSMCSGSYELACHHSLPPARSCEGDEEKIEECRGGLLFVPPLHDLN
jgi:hypothetical protein